MLAMLGKIAKDTVSGVFTVLSDSTFFGVKTLGLIRHTITIIGTILVLKGVATTDSINQVSDKIISLLTSLDGVIGEFLIIVSTVSSYFAKEKQK